MEKNSSKIKEDNLFKGYHTQELITSNKSLWEEQFRCCDKLQEYNNTKPSDIKTRQKLIKEMFAEVGENCFIEIPFHANWGGKHVHIGNNFYSNFNLTLVDDTHIYIGNDVLCAPNVTICTSSHPIDPELRRKGYFFNRPVKIGNNVWIGSGTTILPGVSIGDNTVIGAMSCVTKDIPANVVAFGNPCRVQREIGDYDKEIYFKGHKINYDNVE